MYPLNKNNNHQPQSKKITFNPKNIINDKIKNNTIQQQSILKTAKLEYAESTIEDILSFRKQLEKIINTTDVKNANANYTFQLQVPIKSISNLKHINNCLNMLDGFFIAIPENDTQNTLSLLQDSNKTIKKYANQTPVLYLIKHSEWGECKQLPLKIFKHDTFFNLETVKEMHDAITKDITLKKPILYGSEILI